MVWRQIGNLRGQIGPVGPVGATGIPGVAGIQGEKGERGESIMGAQGPSGERGERGAPGPVGQVGERGPQGERGQPGFLPTAKKWVDEINYAATVVTHSGALWQATRDTGKEPGQSEDWILLCSPGAAGGDGRDGRDGVDGASFTLRGTFDDRATYKALDVVALNRTWFVARRDDPGSCPGPGWQSGPAAVKGERGQRGERGERGLKGEQGLAGRELIDFKVDRTNYTLTPIMSDGSEGPVIRLRELFTQYDHETRG